MIFSGSRHQGTSETIGIFFLKCCTMSTYFFLSENINNYILKIYENNYQENNAMI